MPGLVRWRRHSLLALAADGSRSGVRGDALIPHHSGEILAPLSQHGFVDVEAPTVDTLGLNDQVHVWVLLMRMECHGVAVLRPELLACEHLSRRKYLVRWGRRRHRQHDVVHQLDGAARLVGLLWLPVLPGRELQVPVFDQCILLRFRYPLSLTRLQVELSLLADVRQVSDD